MQLLPLEGEKTIYRSAAPSSGNSLAFPPPLYGTLESRNVLGALSIYLGKTDSKPFLLSTRKNKSTSK